VATIKTNIDSLNKKLSYFFEKQADISLAFLFGSIAEGRNHSLSDIDIAVYYQKSKPIKRHLQLVNDICSLLKTDNVDVVNMNEASPLIMHDILSFGNLLLCRNDNLYVQLRLKALREYDDITHLLKIQSGYIFEAATHG